MTAGSLCCGAALTLWTFQALTVPSVEALQTVEELVKRSGFWAELPRRYTRPTTLPEGRTGGGHQSSDIRDIKVVSWDH